MKKVVMLVFNQYSPDPRVRQEALSLSRNGYEVAIIAWDRKGGSPAREDFADIHHIGPKLPAGFADMGIGLQATIKLWSLIVFSLRASRLCLGLKPDIIHSNDLDTLHIGTHCARKLGVPLIYDSHEIYPQMMAKDIMPAVKPIAALERFLVRGVSSLITVTGYHEEYFREMGVKDITVVTNCKSVVATEYLPPQNKVFTLLYIGGFNNTRFLREAIEVCGGMDGLIFRIGGGGLISESLEKAAKEAPKKNIEFIGWVPYDEVIRRTTEADAIMCMLDPKNYNNRVGPPNKLFEAMVAGRSVIATKGTYSGQVVEGEAIGLAIDFSKGAFRKAVATLRDDPALRERMGRKALRTALEKYNWKNEELKLLGVYGRIAPSGKHI